jgi:hypothetical protein
VSRVITADHRPPFEGSTSRDYCVAGISIARKRIKGYDLASTYQLTGVNNAQSLGTSATCHHGGGLMQRLLHQLRFYPKLPIDRQSRGGPVSVVTHGSARSAAVACSAAAERQSHARKPTQ